MQLSGSPAMMMPRSQSVSESIWPNAARAAPGPLSSEMPTCAACSLCASSDWRSHRPKSAFRWSGTPPHAYEQLLVGVDAVADVRLVRAEERLERKGRQVAGLAVVRAAESVDVVAPVLVGQRADRARPVEARPVPLDVLGQDVGGERRRREPGDAVPGRPVIGLGLPARPVR